MKIETFEVEPASTEIGQIAQDAAAIELCEQLGLEGQLRKNETETLTRCPYRQMHEDEFFVYSVLCPAKSAPEKFSQEPIPLRVLQVYAHAKGLNIFKRFEIWSAKSAAVKDPVLVGYMVEGGWRDIVYILARWGSELIPVDEMMPAACKRYYTERLAALKKVKAEIDQAIMIHQSTEGIEAVFEVKSAPYVNV